MSVIGEVFDLIAQEINPEVAGIVFPDTMDILTTTTTQDTGGAVIETESTAYADVPVTYEPRGAEGLRRTIGDRQFSLADYVLTFPTHHEGERLTIDAKNYRFKVLERGNEPEKTFRIETLVDESGVDFIAYCIKEN